MRLRLRGCARRGLVPPERGAPGREVDPRRIDSHSARGKCGVARSRGRAPTARGRPRRPIRRSPGCPSRRPARCVHRVGIGHEVRHRAVRPLLGGEVAQPLGGEADDVVEVGGGPDVDLPVTGPSRDRSRVGQSVGMSHALPRKLQSAARWRRLMRSSEHAKAPIALQIGVHDDARDVAGRRAARGGLRRGRSGSPSCCAEARRRRPSARRT